MSHAKKTVFPLVLAENSWTLPYLSIGMVAAFLRTYKSNLLAEYYDIEPLILGGLEHHPLDELYRKIQSTDSSVCLFSSYVWNHKTNLEAARRIKHLSPDSVLIFGGPEVPKYVGDTEQFLIENSFVDIAVLGEGELSCAEILEELASGLEEGVPCLHSIDGIVFNDNGNIVRTRERARIRDINDLPSPYLSGEFGDWFVDFSNTILETNRGCPYGCTYCDWGSATLQKVTRFLPARVIAEIEFLASRRAQAIFIADANFGMLEQDIEIAEALVEISQRTGYPKKLVTNFAKNGGRRLMAVTRILHEGGLLPSGIIALQTTDDQVLKAIKRDNIKTSTYETMMEYFSEQRIPIATDLMIGLPGQTVASLVRDLQYCFDWKVSANGNFTSMMPNAPMAEKSYIKQYQIETDSEGLIASTSTFSRADMAYMRAIFTVYQFYVRLGVLRYFLYYLQLEHGVKAMDFLCKWMDNAREYDSTMPISEKLYRDVFAMESRHGDWLLMSWGDEALFFFQDLEAFYEEMFTFLNSWAGICVPLSVRRTIIDAQSAVMPKMARKYPHCVQLDHDVVAYFDQLKSAASLQAMESEFVKLENFPQGKLAVTPKIKFKKSIQFTKLTAHNDEWELPSSLRFY